MTLEEIENLCNHAGTGPWKWARPNNKEESDILYPGRDDWETELITRDSGHYGPDVPTCEFIIASRTLMPKLLAIAKAAYQCQEQKLITCVPGYNCPTCDLFQAFRELDYL